MIELSGEALGIICTTVVTAAATIATLIGKIGAVKVRLDMLENNHLAHIKTQLSSLEAKTISMGTRLSYVEVAISRYHDNKDQDQDKEPAGREVNDKQEV
ncbi:hypothetical protein LCGC14_2436090 [marine sediment metagenome]|uniref:Uncharacterized protein n=1 Tax=marine sediment metagenome TaxID=412755 RepID=A0A0F9BKJ8_9ZZZZ